MALWLDEAHYTNMQKCINYVRKYGIQNLKEKNSDLHSKQMFTRYYF